MLRWVIRAAAANRYKNKVISESNRASTKSKDAVRSFNRAKREKDSVKKMEYMSEGLVSLSEAVSHNSNSVEPLELLDLKKGNSSTLLNPTIIIAGIARMAIIKARTKLNLLSQRFGATWKSDLGINSAVISTTMVVATVWTKRAVIGDVAEFQSAASKIA